MYKLQWLHNLERYQEKSSWKHEATSRSIRPKLRRNLLRTAATVLRVMTQVAWLGIQNLFSSFVPFLWDLSSPFLCLQHSASTSNPRFPLSAAGKMKTATSLQEQGRAWPVGPPMSITCRCEQMLTVKCFQDVLRSVDIQALSFVRS